MKNRRELIVAFGAALVGMVVVVGPALAAELMGTIKAVDVSGKKLTVVEKGTNQEVEVTVTDDTDYITPKKTSKIDLEKLDKNVKAREAGKKGAMYKVTHENKVASKIEQQAAKKKDN